VRQASITTIGVRRWVYGWVIRAIFFGGGVVVFLWGILRKRVFLWWFFDGENMVECVVNVVFWQSLFRGGKMRQIFEIYFLGFLFWE
jgi:hypothetical protein